MVCSLVAIGNRLSQDARSVYRRQKQKPVLSKRFSVLTIKTRQSLLYSAGVTSAGPRTIGELRASGHKRETVKQEMRRNLLTRLRSGEPLLAGLVGYDGTVLPPLATAGISGHHVVMVGQRRQAQ